MAECYRVKISSLALLDHKWRPKRIQSARVSHQSSELAPPPLTRTRVLPPPPPPLWFQGRGDTLAGGRGGGGNQFARRDRHSGTLGTYSIILLRWNPHHGVLFKIIEGFLPIKCKNLGALHDQHVLLHGRMTYKDTGP
jgi:hypothetical protein